jgi:ABC-type nitrate/sulfonate/bicarbonate transport system permease component
MARRNRGDAMMAKRWSSFAIASIPAIVILLAMEIFARATFELYGLPGPSRVMVTLLRMIADGSLTTDILVSLGRIMSGFAIGSALGVTLGLFFGTVRWALWLFDPYVQFLRFVPPISLISVAVIFFGIGEAAKVSLIVFTTTFLVLLSTINGVQATPKNRLRVARTFGAGPLSIFAYVILPSTVWHIFTGMRIGMGASFATVVVAEMLAARSGLGSLIFNSYQYLDIAKIFIGILTLGTLGFLADLGLRGVETTMRRFRPLGY